MPLLFCSSLRPLVVFVSRCVFFVGGFHWLTVKGEQHTAKEAPIIALAPHSSYFDALAIVYLNLSTVVAKKETSLAPVIGSMSFSKKFSKFVYFSGTDFFHPSLDFLKIYCDCVENIENKSFFFFKLSFFSCDKYA